MKKVMSSFDIHAISFELGQKIVGKHIHNIYQVRPKLFLIKLKPGDLDLIIEVERRIHLTRYELRLPRTPTQFCMALRKYLVGTEIVAVTQHEFERILTLEVDRTGVRFRLVAEIFRRGNLVLVGPDDRIILALYYARMRDRSILRKEHFQNPPSTGIDFAKPLSEIDLLALPECRRLELRKALVSFLPIGVQYADEICLRAGLDRNLIVDRISEVQMKSLRTVVNSLKSEMQGEKIKPQVVLDEERKPIDVLSFPLRTYEGFAVEHYPSFNEAADKYFSEVADVEERLRIEQEASERIEEVKRILAMQEKQLAKLKRSSEECQKIGDTIYTRFVEIEPIAEMAREARTSGKSNDEVEKQIRERIGVKEQTGITIESVDMRNALMYLSFDGISFSLDFSEELTKEAARYYEKAKRAREKIVGVQVSMGVTRTRLEAAGREASRILEQVRPLSRRREKAWYEKFHWFHSSEGLLVVAGRDATSNELLVRRHMERDDVVFHAEVHGAPFAIVKAQGKAVGENTIREAAQLAACYSKAWAREWGSADVYWVRPEQLSKNPPAGEYLARGMFMVYGSKNYVRGIDLRVAIGVLDIKGETIVIGGPPSAIESRTKTFVTIAPGENPSGRLAKQVLSQLLKSAPKSMRKSIAGIRLEEIQRFIPSGRGDISR